MTPRTARPPAASTAASLLRAAVLVVLCQLPFWLMQVRLSINRPIFNLDLFVALLIALRSRRWGLAAMVVAWVVEICRDASISYHFMDTAELVDAVRFADLVQLHEIFSWKLLAGIAAMAASLLAIHRLVATRPPAKAFVVVLALLAIGADTLNGSSRFLGMGADRFRISSNVAGSPTWNVVFIAISTRHSASRPLAKLPQANLYAAASEFVARDHRTSVLLVLVESMGRPRAPALDAWLAGRLATPGVTSRWSVTESAEPFYGSTIYGELRVLCGLRGHYSRLRPDDEAQCLPQRFLAAGESVFGLHGFTMKMFDRRQWWPALGIPPQAFPAVDGVEPRTGCNDAFLGVCDGVVLERAARLADTPGRLVYVVTLDTHLPMPASGSPVAPDLAVLCEREKTPELACRMIDRLGNVMGQLAADLAGMTHPPLVLVSGDHAPPFIDRGARSAFDTTQVPTFVLAPKTP